MPTWRPPSLCREPRGHLWPSRASGQQSSTGGELRRSQPWILLTLMPFLTRQRAWHSALVLPDVILHPGGHRNPECQSPIFPLSIESSGEDKPLFSALPSSELQLRGKEHRCLHFSLNLMELHLKFCFFLLEM